MWASGQVWHPIAGWVAPCFVAAQPSQFVKGSSSGFGLAAFGTGCVGPCLGLAVHRQFAARSHPPALPLAAGRGVGNPPVGYLAPYPVGVVVDVALHRIASLRRLAGCGRNFTPAGGWLSIGAVRAAGGVNRTGVAAGG